MLVIDPVKTSLPMPAYAAVTKPSAACGVATSASVSVPCGLTSRYLLQDDMSNNIVANVMRYFIFIFFGIILNNAVNNVINVIIEK